jgi:hypothetical protein
MKIKFILPSCSASIIGGIKVGLTFGQHFQMNIQFKNSKQKVVTLLHLGGFF